MAEVAVFQDQQSSGVAGTTITGTLADQPLNTEIFNNITGASLSSNQVTLPAGDYVINIIDRWKPSSSSYSVRYFITDTSNNILDATVSGMAYSASDFHYVSSTVAISLSVSTAIKLRAAAIGSSTRDALSLGTECYQKLIIQKL